MQVNKSQSEESKIMIFDKTRSSMRECLVLILFITAFLPFHLAYSTVLQQETISTVDQESIPIEKFQERIRFDRWYNALFFHSLYEQGNLDWQQMPDVYAEALDILQHPQVHGERVLDLMERELIIKHAADSRGITVEPSLVEGLLSKDLAQLSSIESVDEFF